MSHRHHTHGSEHRSCEAIASTSEAGGLQENIVESTSSHHILSDTDSGIDGGDSNRPPRPSNRGQTGTRPKSVTSTEAGTTSSSSASSSVDLHTLRDPSHYEELNVIGNGESKDHENFLFIKINPQKNPQDGKTKKKNCAMKSAVCSLSLLENFSTLKLN